METWARGQGIVLAGGRGQQTAAGLSEFSGRPAQQGRPILQHLVRQDKTAPLFGTFPVFVVERLLLMRSRGAGGGGPMVIRDRPGRDQHSSTPPPQNTGADRTTPNMRNLP